LILPPQWPILNGVFDPQGDRPMKVSLVQMNSISDKAVNIGEARRLMEEVIAADKPDLVVLPENFDFLGGTTADKLRASETIPGGPAYSMCREIAAKHRVFVHAGSLVERVEGENRVHNTTVVFDRSGREIARYRKIHLFDITTPDGIDYKESASVKPGDTVATYDLEGATVGCAICYDLRFPELFQALAKKGAQVIALPAAFTLQTGKDHWEVLCRARAIETQTYFLAAGQTGSYMSGNGVRHNYGHSMVIDPWGHVVAKASDGVGTVSSKIDLNRVKKARADMPVQNHRVLS
jgi:deaminated glutathione amidase